MTAITFATSIKNGQSIYKQYKARMPLQEALVRFTLAYIRKFKLINFHPDVKIHIKPIKRWHGLHYIDKNLVVLNVRDNPIQMIETLLHELKHSEQHFEGRLSIQYDYKQGRWLDIWNGEVNKVSNNTTSTKRYMELPWEVEAFATAKFTKEIWEAYRKQG